MSFQIGDRVVFTKTGGGEHIGEIVSIQSAKHYLSNLNMEQKRQTIQTWKHVYGMEFLDDILIAIKLDYVTKPCSVEDFMRLHNLTEEEAKMQHELLPDVTHSICPVAGVQLLVEASTQNGKKEEDSSLWES